MNGVSGTAFSSHFFSMVRLASSPANLGRRCSGAEIKGALYQTFGIKTAKTGTALMGNAGDFTVTAGNQAGQVGVEVSVIKLDLKKEEANDKYSFGAQCGFPMALLKTGLKRSSLFEATCFHVASRLSPWTPDAVIFVLASAVPGHTVTAGNTLVERFSVTGTIITTMGFE